MPSDKVVVQFRLRSMAKQGSCGPKVAYPATVHICNAVQHDCEQNDGFMEGEIRPKHVNSDHFGHAKRKPASFPLHSDSCLSRESSID